MGRQLPDGTRSLIRGAVEVLVLSRQAFGADDCHHASLIIGCGCTVVLGSSTFARPYKHIRFPFSIREVSQVAFLTPPKASSD